jgi:hypothetical protein
LSKIGLCYIFYGAFHANIIFHDDVPAILLIC